MEQRSYGKEGKFKSFVLIFSALILDFHEQTVTGQLTLSPMTVAPVCHVGDPLLLTCTAPVANIEWSFTVVNQHGKDEPVTGFITAGAPVNQSVLIQVNSTTFTWIRNSTQNNSQPLIVTLSIDSVSAGLNGTMVNCTDPGNPMSVASTTIQIIDTSNDHYSPTLRIVSEQYSADNVTVTVEWTQQELYATYNVAVVPLVSIVFTESISRRLTIPYNKEYNLTIEATARCRPTTTAVIKLKYVNCGDPELLLAANYSVPDIEGYDGLPINGSTIKFTCPPGLELIGEPSSNSATCTESGGWVPDPSDFMCTNDTDIDFTDDSKMKISDNIILIVSISAVVIVCVLALIILVAVILYRKGLAEKRIKQSSPTEYKGGGKHYSKHSSSHKVVYQKKGLWIENNDQRPQEDLVYADVTIATKCNKMATAPNKPSTTITPQPDVAVEYSAINYKLCNKKPVMKENPNQYDDSLDVTLDKLLALLREEVGPRWYDFGEAVGIDGVVLDSIAKTTFPENCIVEVLDYWLKYFYDDEKLTWSDVAIALRDINLQELAYHIEQEYAIEADSEPSIATPSAPMKMSGIQPSTPVPPPRY